MQGSTILVTGGAGFIGSHLVDVLLARGDRVVVLDNLPAGRISNLDRVACHPNFEFVQGSILDEVIVDELMHRCDTVVHLAAAVGVKLIMNEPLRSFNTNLRGSQTVISAAHRYQRKIMIASTSEIYGKNSRGPLAETADRVIGSPTLARWAYSTAKAVDETLANAYHRERGLPTVVVRFFNVVGPRQSPHNGMVIPRLVRQAIRNEPLTIYGDGSQIRCFTHVLDAVAALATLLETEAAIGETFNVGNPEEVSILELAERIIKHSASSSQLRLMPYDTAYAAGFEDVERRVPDIGKLCSLTNWRPVRTLDDIIQDTIAEAQAEARMSRV
ncbi:NAD-dependent epimerase/dehydratase family protein [Micromonospora sonneratiae]|uniref:NAD-dependent epimerase/dehydratase family protein n=1 Tax=Micromonospora sonneratiae TaxID=1184706 RepID=A0ABW3YA84_9ACTN